MAKKSAADVFKDETAAADNARRIIEGSDTLSKDEVVKEFHSLLANFDQLLGDATMITSISDRLQNKLNSANDQLKFQADEINKKNQALDSKNKELQETIDELTRARVGRQAATITLFLFVILFVTEEIFIGPQIDAFTNNHLYYGALIKGAVALLLKPLEGFVEKIMLSQVIKAEKKKKALEALEAAQAENAAKEAAL